MNVSEVEVILFEFKIISGLFLALTTLIIFVWKTESKKRDENRKEDNEHHTKMFNQHGKILEEVKKAVEKLSTKTAIHSVQIENLKNKK